MKYNHIIRTLRSNNLHKNAVRVFQYAFIDISQDAILRLIEKLGNLSVDTSDDKAAELIFDWHTSLTDKEYLGFPMTDSAYLENKAATIANIIRSGFPSQSIELEGSALLDIGAGDCAMTYLVSKQLNLESCAIDIQTEIDWGGQNSSDKEYMQKISQQYVYDGSDLLGALGNKKFKVIMLNHSLHHFLSFNDQQDCFRQIAELLEPNGILFLSEHDNCVDDDILELFHLVLNLRFSIDKHKVDPSCNNQIPSLEKFKEDYGSANYFSRSMIYYLAKKFGFQLVKEKMRSENDVAKTIFYCLRRDSAQKQARISHGFSEESLNFTKNRFIVRKKKNTLNLI